MALKEDLDAIKEKFRTSKYECNYCFTFSLGCMKRFGCLPAQSLKILSRQITSELRAKSTETW